MPAPRTDTSSPPRPAPFARDARNAIAAAVTKAKGDSVKIALAAPAAGRLEITLRDSRRRTVTRRTLNYATGAKRTITLRPGRATTVTVRWVPKRGAPERATRALTRRRAA